MSETVKRSRILKAEFICKYFVPTVQRLNRNFFQLKTVFFFYWKARQNEYSTVSGVETREILKRNFFIRTILPFVFRTLKKKRVVFVLKIQLIFGSERFADSFVCIRGERINNSKRNFLWRNVYYSYSGSTKRTKTSVQNNKTL